MFFIALEFPKYQDQVIETIKSQEYKVTYKHPVLTTEEIIMGINRANFLWNNYELSMNISTQDTSLMIFYGGSVPGKFRREFYRKEDLCADVRKALEREVSRRRIKKKVIPLPKH